MSSDYVPPVPEENNKETSLSSAEEGVENEPQGKDDAKTRYGPFPYVVFALLVLAPFYNGLSGFKFVIDNGGRLLCAYFIALVLWGGISIHYWYSHLQDKTKANITLNIWMYRLKFEKLTSKNK